MLTHTLIHSDLIFSDIVLFFLCAGSFYLIFKLHSKWRRSIKITLIDLYKMSLFVNIFVLMLVIILHSSILKNMFSSNKNILYIIYLSVAAILFGIYYATVEARVCGIKQSNCKQNEKKFKFIIMVIIIGVCEEILFRGVINEIALSVKNDFKIILILAGIISFGVSHLFSGWLQCISKTILSCFMALFFILSGTVLVPLLAHATFNFCIAKNIHWRQREHDY